MIRGNKPNKSSCVLMENYYDGLVLEPQRIKKPTKVKNLITNEIYKTIKAAAEAENINYQKLIREFKKSDIYNNLKMLY